MEHLPIDEVGIITNNSYMNISTANPMELALISNTYETGINRHPDNITHVMLDLIPNYSKSEQFDDLTGIIRKIFLKLNESERNILRVKLNGHIGVYKTGKPWIDLEAAWILNLSEDLHKQENKRLPDYPPLQESVKRALSEGRHVPIQHLIHALHLAQFNPEIEEYPLAFTNVVPISFINEINRSDVLRGINVHALFLGVNFPLIGVQFASVIENLYCFMFKQRYSSIAGMELYNELFYDFTCKLGIGIVDSLDHIPPVLKKRVTDKYIPIK